MLYTDSVCTDVTERRMIQENERKWWSYVRMWNEVVVAQLKAQVFLCDWRKKTPGLSPPANYTDRATAACQGS
jgi:hypothetical protein